MPQIEEPTSSHTEMERFILNAVRTESADYTAIIQRLIDPRIIRLLHSGIGLATEGGELLDALKKSIFYGKPLDNVNLKEELGDLLWYIAVAMHEMGWTFEEVANLTINKLRLRYPDKFTGYHAVNRDTVAERTLLEQEAVLRVPDDLDVSKVGLRIMEVAEETERRILTGNIP